MIFDVNQWAWIGLFIFQVLVSFLFFILYSKDRDKRKLMFGIGFLLTSYYYIFNIFDIGFSSGESLFLNNIRGWAVYPILFALVIMVSDRLLKIKDFSRFFILFLSLIVASFLLYVALPESANFYVTSVSNVIIAAYVLIVTVYLSMKIPFLENILFLLAIICLGVAGILQNSGINEGISIFAFFMGNIFIGLVFYSMHIQQKKIDSSLMDYFSLKERLSAAKSALNESEDLFRTLFDEMVDSIAIVDKKGKILEISNKVTQDTGYSKEELVGKNFLDLDMFNTNTKKQLVKTIALLIAGKHHAPYEVIVYPKGDKPHFFELRAEKISYKGNMAFMASFRDITYRKKIDQEIVEKNEELGLLNKINVAINTGKSLDDVLKLIGDETGRIFRTTNATIYLMSKDEQCLIPKHFGLSNDRLAMVEKITGHNISHHKIPLDKDSYYTRIVNEKEPRLINDKESMIQLAADYTDNGVLKRFSPTILKMLNVNSTMSVPILSQDKCIGLIDISGAEKFTENDLLRFKRIADQLSIAVKKITVEDQVKEAQNELKEMNKTLEKKVEERTDQIQQLLQQKDDFINQLGHDLKNPLGPLINLIPVIEKSTTDPTTKEMLQIINRNVGYMKNLVINTIELARLNSPTTQFSYENTNLYDLSQTVVNNNSYLLNEKNIQFYNNIPKNCDIQVDKLRFEELMNNLLNNAVKYSYDQGRILLDAKDNTNYFTISLADNGIGMNKEQLNHIFDEFYKADKSRHDFESSGLGMPICKRIVEKHGGQIWVESNGISKGTTIYFTVKKTQITDSTPEKEIKLNPATQDRIRIIEYKGKTILFLDYSYLNEQDYHKANDHIEQYILGLNKDDLLILTDITGDQLSIESLKNSKKMSASVKKYVKKNAVVGLSKSHNMFLKAMKYFTGLEIKSFDNIDLAKDWLVQD